MSRSRNHLSGRDVLIFLAVQGLIVALVVLVSAHAKASEGAAAQEKVYAVIVAHNGSVDSGVRPLRYADDDGARYWELFSAMSDDVTLLTTLDPDTQAVYEGVAPHTRPPTRGEVLRTLRKVQAQLKADRDAGVRTTLFVVFAGHGAVDDTGMGYLSLLDDRFTRQDLVREVISPDLADRTHLIIDACNAYFMVHERGGGEDGGGGAWRDDRSGQTRDMEFGAFLSAQGTLARYPRVGVLLSTAGAAEVHEWSEYRGGVFSHEVRSGLLGAADIDGDKAVTYLELEAYLEAANASVQDPRARIQVFTEAPRQFQEEPLVRLAHLGKATLLEVSPGTRGRYHIADSRGVRYADFHSAGDGAFHLALLQNAPIFFVRTEAQEARVVPEQPVVRLAELDFTARDGVRGPVEESYRANLFAVPYGQGFYAGFHAGRSRPQRAAASIGDVNVEPTRALRAVGLRTAYVLSSSQLGNVAGIDDGVQHNTELATALWFGEHFALEIFAQFGVSAPLSTDAGETIVARRFAGGVGVTGDWRLGRSPLRVEAGLRTAHQGLWATYEATTSDDSSRRGDPFSWRAEAFVGLVMPIAGGWEVGARGGASVSVFSFTERQDDAPREVVDVLPFGGLTFGYRFD